MAILAVCRIGVVASPAAAAVIYKWPVAVIYFKSGWRYACIIMAYVVDVNGIRFVASHASPYHNVDAALYAWVFCQLNNIIAFRYVLPREKHEA